MADPSATVSNESADSGSEGGPMMPGPDEIRVDPVAPPKTDEPFERRYREAPVQAVHLDPEFVEDAGGPFTRKGTPRLEVLAASRAAFLQRQSDAAESDALKFDSEHFVVREEGEHVKSIQGHAEDVWRRIYKRPLPEGDPLEHSEFRRFYDRTRRALKRSDLLVDEGSPVKHAPKRERDKHGKKWSLSDRLQKAQRGREIADPPPVVRCKGEPPEDGRADVWARVERQYAREEKLHCEFTHARTARRVREGYWDHRTAKARRWERKHLRDGTDAARHVSIGRWREEAIGRDDYRNQWNRCPWLVAELDADTRAENDRLARRLCGRLDEADADLSAVLVAYSGNKSLHIRLPDGMLGCPLYRGADVARRRIESFFRRLCEDDPELLDALDFGVCSPTRTIRAIGSTHPDTGRRTVACTADKFLDRPASFLFSLSEPQFQYSPPETFPLPRRADFVPALSALLDPPKSASKSTDSEPGSELNVQQCSSGGIGDSVAADLANDVDVLDGVGEGRRNDVALRVAHRMLTREDSQREAWARVCEWNQRNDPLLDRRELWTVFESAATFRRGFVDTKMDVEGSPAGSGGGGSGGRVYSVWGDTYPFKEMLKERGFWWDDDEGVWRTRNPVAFRKAVKSLSAIPVGKSGARIPPGDGPKKRT